jgi:hypothetical protein
MGDKNMTNLSFDDLATVDFDGVCTKDDEHSYVEKCLKCNGTGTWVGGYVNHTVRKCFACNGKGFKEFKHSPEVRKVNRERAKASAETKRVAQAEVGAKFLDQHGLIDWIAETKDWNEFARSMRDAALKYGSLTERQLAAAKASAEKHFAKKAAKVETEKKNAVQIDTAGLMPILTAFGTAKENGLKRPKLRFEGFQLSLAPSTGVNAGSIYVKNGDEYLGKITAEGQFIKPRSLPADIAKAIDEKLIIVGQNPMEAAVAYGRRTGVCSCCGRELTRADSIERSMGAICAAKYGF